MEQNLLGGWEEDEPANDSIQGKAIQIPDALSMVLLFIFDLPNIFMSLGCFIHTLMPTESFAKNNIFKKTR